jgi:hypothetical protein
MMDKQIEAAYLCFPLFEVTLLACILLYYPINKTSSLVWLIAMYSLFLPFSNNPDYIFLICFEKNLYF